MDDITVRKGETTPHGFPHICRYSVVGVDKSTCVSHSSNYRRNADGCALARCNSAMRRCLKCVEIGRGSKANACTDPITGMCGEHAVAHPVQKHIDPSIIKPPPVQPERFRMPPAMPVMPDTSIGRRATRNSGGSPSAGGPLLGKTTARQTKTAPHVPAQNEPDGRTMPPGDRADIGKKTDTAPGPMLGKKAENPEWVAIVARVRKAIADAVVIRLPPDRFRPMPDQPRDYFDPDEMESLQRSIEEVGQIQDGLCRPAAREGTSDYELLDGERRLRSIINAKLPEYRAKCVDIDDEAAPFLIAAIANFNRPEHTPLEKANVIHRLFTHRLKVPMPAIAKLLGISAGTAYKLHSLKNLPQEVWDLLDPRKVRKGEDTLPLTAGYEIARLTDPRHAEYAKDFGKRVFLKQMPLHRLAAEVDMVLARSETLSHGGGRAGGIRERDQPARRFRFAQRKIDLVFNEFDAALERIREMHADGTLPPEARHVDIDMNRLIRMGKEVIQLAGGVLDPEHGTLPKCP